MIADDGTRARGRCRLQRQAARRAKAPAKKPEFWTIWDPAGIFQVCSKHRTFEAALSAARQCERRGGAPHDIYEVILRSDWQKRLGLGWEKKSRS